LIAEFGSPDRQLPEDEASTLYPTLYHMGIWASLFSGQAGTVMDWDDGKEFGELQWRQQPGVFDKEHYPVDNAGQVKAMRSILDHLDPEDLRPLRSDSPIHIEGPAGGRALALASVHQPSAVHGWVFAPQRGSVISISGLPPGDYALTWDDPWQGTRLPGTARSITVTATGLVDIPLDQILATMRPLQAFPQQARLDSGKDVVFHLVMGAK
jgi:hypothetical protein